MRKWTKTAAAIFVAASAVYPVSALYGQTAKPAKGADQARTEAVLADETAGPVTGATATAAATPAQGTVVNATSVAMSDAGLVEIHVNEASLPEVLRMLSLQARKNIIASKEVRGTVTANLYGVTVKEALEAILNSTGCGYREKGNFIYVYTAKELEAIQKAEARMATRSFRLFYTPASVAANMIKPVLSENAQVSFVAEAKRGIEQGGVKDSYDNAYASDDVLVVTDFPEKLDEIGKVLKDLDRRPQQILIEATIVSAVLDENNALGVDFAILGGVDFASISNVGATVSDALTGTIVNNAAAGGIVNSGYNATATDFRGGIGQGGLRVGIVNDNIAMFLQALEAVTNTTVLANPKVLALNRQKGEVLVGRESGYLTTTVTESATVQTVEFLKTGTRLIFRPFVAEDGYIRLEVHPEDSDGSVVNGLPVKTTTEVTTQVMVKDGHTVVIGGLFREGTTMSRKQVPVMGNLPLVGPLFRGQADTTRREEIMILLTPHVIKDDARYADVSEAQLREIEKLRVGVRRGLMPWGRERLAENCYERAAAELNKPTPNQKKAIWWLNCATNLNPVFLEAINLKAKLTGKEVTSVDNSSIRYFIKRQVMTERAMLWQEQNMPFEPVLAVAEPATAPPTVSAPATQPAAPAVAGNDQTPGTIENPVANTPIQAPTGQPGNATTVVENQAATPEAAQPQVMELPYEVRQVAPAELTPIEVSEAPATQPAGEQVTVQEVGTFSDEDVVVLETTDAPTPPATQPATATAEGTEARTPVIVTDAPTGELNVGPSPSNQDK